MSARRRRRDADRLIAGGARVGRDLAWRADELTSPRERQRLVRSLHDILDELSGTTLPGASPLNRSAVRAHAPELVALADRLADLEWPVAAPGMLAARSFVTDPGSPLYTPEEIDRMSGMLVEILVALERR